MWAGHGDKFSLLVYSRAVATTSFMIAVLFVSAICLRIMVLERPRHLTRAIVDEFKQTWLTRERLTQGIPLVSLYMLFMASFSSIKSLIPAFHPYAWDAAWIAWDRSLHGGDPWVWTHALLGAPLVTFIINFLYNMWFPVMFAFLYWQAFSLKEEHLQKRFFLSFFLTWIINGTVLAIALSSAGPCFYERLTGDATFAPLMSALAELDETYPVWALHTQDLLWTVYQKRGLDVGSGISAMPSVHVAIAFLLFLFALKKCRVLGIAMGSFFAAILIGSVHLGWHYAVDGYIGMIVTAIIWWMTGRLYKERGV